MRVLPDQLVPGARSLDDILDRHHVGIFGPTGSGKSVLSMHWYESTHGVRIFFNPEEEPVRGAVHCKSVAQVKKAIAEKGANVRIELYPGAKVDQMDRVLTDLRDELFRIGDRLRRGRSKVDRWCTLFAAEAQLYSPKTDRDGPLPDIQRRGRKRGIRAVTDSQEPASVSHTALKQSTVKCLFGFDPIEMEYFRNYSVPIDEFADHVAQDHHWVMTKGSQWVPYIPVPFRE